MALESRRFFISLSVGLMLAGCSGTGDGGTGDPPSDPNANKLGDGARIADVIGPAVWLDPEDTDSLSCKVPLDHHVQVTGVTIVAIDRYDETKEGATGNYYVQDASLDPSEYSGVTVFSPGFSPPNLRLANGDVADIGGSVTEFLGPSSGRFGNCKTLPEISGTMSFRFENGPLVPKTIPLEDLKTYATARKWLGMLVRVENIAIAGSPADSGGRYTATINVGGGVDLADVPKISNELYDIKNEGPTIEDQSTFSSVTGVITYFYGFKIAPRSKDDFVP